MKKSLGIDYGTVRIGVAVSYASLAEPLVIIPSDEEAFERLRQLVAEHKVEQIAVGISENQMAEKTRLWAEKLEDKLGLPVALVDETLSSHQVHECFKKNSYRKRPQHIDHYAAAVILQSFLDAEVNSVVG